MNKNQYVTPEGPLYYFCRLDRYTPSMARFISWGTEIATPMTQAEIVAIIRENFESTRQTNKRGFPHVGCERGLEVIRDFNQSDNNHSGFWKYGYVHTIGRPVSFWNLDADFDAVIREALSISPSSAKDLIHELLYTLAEQEPKRIELLTQFPDMAFLKWLDEKCTGLPPAPDPENYDEDVANDFYNAIADNICNALADETRFNGDIARLLVFETTKPDGDGQRFKANTLNIIISYILPLNKNAEGYIVDGYYTMKPVDAMRGAIFVGNICDVMQTYLAGEPLLSGKKPAGIYAHFKDRIKNGDYPAQMSNGMPSDWLTNGPHPTLAFVPGQEYPQISGFDLGEAGYEAKSEYHAVFAPPDPDVLRELKQKAVLVEQINYDVK